ncbi:PREDICTED: uncharacterized protein LOC107070800 [Polistes dominula]|uniref:Uncharacterized protein LOC107070800 n=1 Tax=Polistes dominula TaxID=743375 RepID=A0ABM1IX57_POLDO|nr:PREDICTED: uncharacterized protein LOC107070800 [Polistes dominula]
MLTKQMESKVEEKPIPKQTKDDINVPAVTAKLEMLTVDTNNTNNANNNTTNAESIPEPRSRIILRKRIPKKSQPDSSNRRCSLRPKKRSLGDMESDENIMEYYLDKNSKYKANNLETIFEETANTNENFSYMGAKKYKRMIKFEEQPTDNKLKKRKTKIKRIFGSKINFRRKCGSMDVLLDKLNYIRSNSPTNSESETK